MRSKSFMSKINLQRGKLTVENRKSREKKRIYTKTERRTERADCRGVISHPSLVAIRSVFQLTFNMRVCTPSLGQWRKRLFGLKCPVSLNDSNQIWIIHRREQDASILNFLPIGNSHNSQKITFFLRNCQKNVLQNGRSYVPEIFRKHSGRGFAK